jgi:hypothetical protein
MARDIAAGFFLRVRCVWSIPKGSPLTKRLGMSTELKVAVVSEDGRRECGLARPLKNPEHPPHSSFGLAGPASTLGGSGGPGGCVCATANARANNEVAKLWKLSSGLGSL